jgi:formylglycine-generating enzyme required for sulfatase activity
MTKTPGRLSSRIALVALALAAALPARLAAAQGCPSADLNGDRRVSGADISVLLGEWGTSGGTTGADLNGSGLVTGADLAIVLEQWGQSCPSEIVPYWATLIEAAPDPSIITDPLTRASIEATGFAWRVRHAVTQAEMLLVPPGTFEMGCVQGTTQGGCSVAALPVHAVTITQPFYIGRYETTQSEWRRVMGSNPAYHRWLRDSPVCPVETVSGNDIRAFLVISGARLPSEAQWEFAYRAGTSTAYHNASNDETSASTIGVVGQGITGSTRAVGSLSGNRFGLHDMTGNVLERVADWYGPYEGASQVDPLGPTTGTSQVYRGGDYLFDARSATGYFRSAASLDHRSRNCGFRMAMNVAPSELVVPPWAVSIAMEPDPAVIVDQKIRDRIRATGYAWHVRDSATGIEFVLVPPGVFRMGCSASTGSQCPSDEYPVREVTLTRPFYVSRTEVTQGQWAATMSSNPSSFQEYSDSPSRPVESVTWNSVQDFLAQSGARLLTEAEWEYAYRAGTTTAFHGTPSLPAGSSSDASISAIAWQSNNAAGQTNRAGVLQPNGFGLHDMGGNVWEWVADFYGTYGDSSQTDPGGPAVGASRVVRGGAWNSSTDFVRSSKRGGLDPRSSASNLGFRIARNP